MPACVVGPGTKIHSPSPGRFSLQEECRLAQRHAAASDVILVVSPRFHVRFDYKYFKSNLFPWRIRLTRVQTFSKTVSWGFLFEVVGISSFSSPLPHAGKTSQSSRQLEEHAEAKGLGIQCETMY